MRFKSLRMCVFSDAYIQLTIHITPLSVPTTGFIAPPLRPATIQSSLGDLLKSRPGHDFQKQTAAFLSPSSRATSYQSTRSTTSSQHTHIRSNSSGSDFNTDTPRQIPDFQSNEVQTRDIIDALFNPVPSTNPRRSPFTYFVDPASSGSSEGSTPTDPLGGNRYTFLEGGLGVGGGGGGGGRPPARRTTSMRSKSSLSNEITIPASVEDEDGSLSPSDRRKSVDSRRSGKSKSPLSASPISATLSLSPTREDRAREEKERGGPKSAPAIRTSFDDPQSRSRTRDTERVGDGRGGLHSSQSHHHLHLPHLPHPNFLHHHSSPSGQSLTPKSKYTSTSRERTLTPGDISSRTAPHETSSTSTAATATTSSAQSTDSGHSVRSSMSIHSNFNSNSGESEPAMIMGGKDKQWWKKLSLKEYSSTST